MKLLSILLLGFAFLGSAAMADCDYYNITDPQLSDATTQCASILQGSVVNQQYTGTDWIVTCQYDCPATNPGYGPSCSYYNISLPQLSDAITQCASILQGTAVSEQYTGAGWIVQCQYDCQ